MSRIKTAALRLRSRGPAKKATRSPGRPRAAQTVASRQIIVAAARKLMEEAPPHRATILSIARRAGVDRALVRYYFKNRDVLLLAVIEDILDEWNAGHPDPDASAAARLETQVGEMLDFALRVRSMQRLMVEEGASSRSPQVRQRVREINRTKIDALGSTLRANEGDPGASAEPLFLYVAIVGLCEFFAAAQAVILPLAPAGMPADELARRYRKFIMRLTLDGLRSRIQR